MQESAQVGKIDDPTHIRNDNVYIFQSPVDHRVLPGNGRLLLDMFTKLGARLKTELTLEAAHGFVRF